LINPHTIEDAAARPLPLRRGPHLPSVILTCVLLPLGLPAKAASTPSVDAPAAALVKAASGDAVRTGGIVPPRAPSESGQGGTPTKSKVEGAVGLVLRLRPDFIGARSTSTHLSPAGYLRYGRLSLSGSGGFASTGNRDAERGVATELFERGAFRTSLGLRYDPGRKASDSPELEGLGDVQHTVRVKLSAGWEPRRNWHVGLGLSVDALGRGGGVPIDMSLVRSWAIRQNEQLALRLGVSGADQRFMRTWHGVAERERDGRVLPAYTPSAGLRDVSLSVGWRREIRIAGEPFGIFGDVGVQHLLGPAADSPLTLRLTAPVAAAGLAWRF
jgi:outer membrane protein